MENTQPKVRVSPKDFFLQIGTILTLYITIVSLLNLLFEMINIKFPEALDYYVDPYSTALRLSVASLLIVFPTHLFLMRLLSNDFKVNPEKRELGVRKWLVFLTLFIAGATIIVDLIVLINTFLGGEITTRFILKVLSVLVVIGGVFGYYIYDLRGKIEAGSTMYKGFIWASIFVVVGSIIGGYLVVGSPTSQRMKRLDAERVGALQNIQMQIVSYWQQKESLPSNLVELNNPISGFTVPTDPETRAQYEYRATGARSFSLCANFSLPTPVRASGQSDAYMPIEKGFVNENWNHGSGRTCFDRTIDPELYPPKSEMLKIRSAIY